MVLRSKGGDPIFAQDRYSADAASMIAPLAMKAVNSGHGIVPLWKSIHPLTTIASLMNTGAHPDDEHSDTLAYYSLGQGVHTISLIATRGEGGQNEIGSELGEALGVIRTRELQEASSMMNVTLSVLSEAVNDHITDFGFSKCANETLTRWGETIVYERLVRSIREHRPDVVFTAFLNVETTHGHHRAMTILTLKAFDDAANPAVFPEHAQAGFRPWQIKKMYVPAAEDEFHVFVPTGEFNEIYGASYVQIGEHSRFLHKTQGMGSHIEEGPSNSYYQLEKSIHPIANKEHDFFDGIAFTFEDLAKEIEAQGGEERIISDLYALHSDVLHIVSAFPRFSQVAVEAQRMRVDVANTIADISISSLSADAKADLTHRLQVKDEQLRTVVSEALCFIAKIHMETPELVPGQTTKVAMTAFNGSNVTLRHIMLQLNAPPGWRIVPLGDTTFPKLEYNQTVSVTYEVTVPDDAQEFNPCAPPIFSGDVRYNVFHIANRFRIYPAHTVAVLPRYSLKLSPAATVLNTRCSSKPILIKATVRGCCPGPGNVHVSLRLPESWKADPAQHELQFQFKGETKTVTFMVQPSAHVESGRYSVSALAVDGRFASSKNIQIIQYPHIGRTYLIRQEEMIVQALDLKVPDGLRIGYVSSGFDNIDQYLRLAGIELKLLAERDIEFGDLSEYDAIVLGIRAYAFRPELIACNERLLQYVRQGGNLVVQYHKPEDGWRPDLAPYPIQIGQPFIKWRVTDENSKVTMLAPEHPLFRNPNVITEEDWNHWIHERSAYIPCGWGGEYTELISTGDPGEDAFTGIYLSAPYGEGIYTYSSLGWYRQIPHLVPGAIRMFVNMISQKITNRETNRWSNYQI